MQGGGEGLPPGVAAQADSSGAVASYHRVAAASPDGVGARLIVCRNSVSYVVSWSLVSWSECNFNSSGKFKRSVFSSVVAQADTVVPWSTIVRSVRAGNEWIKSLAESVAHCALKHVYFGVVYV